MRQRTFLLRQPKTERFRPDVPEGAQGSSANGELCIERTVRQRQWQDNLGQVNPLFFRFGSGIACIRIHGSQGMPRIHNCAAKHTRLIRVHELGDNHAKNKVGRRIQRRCAFPG
jgi:hypothetical protein